MIMATEHLTLRRESDGYFRAQWVDDAGERHRRSFGKAKGPAQTQFAEFRARWDADPRVRNPNMGVLTVEGAWKIYWAHAENHYRDPQGNPTGEAENMADAMKIALREYADLPADKFGVGQLRRVQALMVADGLSVSTVNARVNRIRRVWRWLASRPLIPGALMFELDSLGPVSEGRAVELDGKGVVAQATDPVRPVPDATVDATVAKLPPVLRDMVELHRLTGMRPGELCRMTPAAVTATGPVWVYEPEKHKTQRKTGRRILLGPRAQKIVAAYLTRDVTAPLFDPREAERQRRDAKRDAYDPGDGPDYRQAASYQMRLARSHGHAYASSYNPSTYAKAIERAAEAAGVPHWSPNQLRHNAGSRYRAEAGIDVAQTILGHLDPDTTLIYAQAAEEKAAKVVRRIG